MPGSVASLGCNRRLVDNARMSTAPPNASPATHAATLDARGLVCPEPVRLAEQRIRMLDPGTELLIQVTDPAAPLDLEAWCLRRGHRWLGQQPALSDVIEVRVRKSLTGH